MQKIGLRISPNTRFRKLFNPPRISKISGLKILNEAGEYFQYGMAPPSRKIYAESSNDENKTLLKEGPSIMLRPRAHKVICFNILKSNIEGIFRKNIAIKFYQGEE